MNRSPPPEIVTLDPAEVAAFGRRMRQRALAEEDYELAARLAETLLYLQQRYASKDLALRQLLRLLFGPRSEKAADLPGKSGGKGVFTSAVIAEVAGRRCAIFRTGRQHAGEGLAAILKERTAPEAPIQMCDALARNLPGEFKTLLGNCLVHGRRKFAAVAETFPAECGVVIDLLGRVYAHEAEARQRQLDPAQRLAYHQAHSGPVMAQLHDWLKAQLAEKRTEPNSALGQAMTYMLKHWPPLTLFLRAPGAPLDNNITERALKLSILHRKNALFYKTLRGAAVGDLLMSLIHTCRLNEVNPFDYLSALQTHASRVRTNPELWLPWNYREQLPPQEGPVPPAPAPP